MQALPSIYFLYGFLYGHVLHFVIWSSGPWQWFWTKIKFNIENFHNLCFSYSLCNISSTVPLLWTSLSNIVTQEELRCPKIAFTLYFNLQHTCHWTQTMQGDLICHIWSWPCFESHRPLFSDHILPRPKTLSITNLRSGADISLSDKSNPIWSKLRGLPRFLCEFSLDGWGSAAKLRQNLGWCWSNCLSRTTFLLPPTPFYWSSKLLFWLLKAQPQTDFLSPQNQPPSKTPPVPSWNFKTRDIAISSKAHQ